jgi:rubrerythrin
MKIFLGNNKINKLNYIRENANEDIQEVDSLGNPLSSEQSKYFKNSKVRDRQGNLLVCYHGTDSKFSTFEKGDIGFHFGTESAGTDRQEYKSADNWMVGKYYLNIKNPFVEEFDYGGWDGVTIACTWLFGTSYDGYIDWIKFNRLPDEIYVPQEFMCDIEEIKRISRLNSEDIEYDSEGSVAMRALFKKHHYDGIKYMNNFEGDTDWSYIAFEPNQIKNITNQSPTNSSNINEELLSESLHKLGSNCFITNSPYDIKNLIANKPKLYRILYDSNIDMYMIGDGNEVIHWDMLKESHRQGYYANYEDYIDSLGSLYNYFDVGTGGDYNGEEDVDPFLWFIVFSPDEQSWVLGADSYDAEYHSPYGNIFTRDCDLKDIELYKVLKVSNDVKNLYDNKELTEKMSTSIKSGDRVKMDFHMKSNNGATGTCKGRLGELCSIEWDDGSKSKEIASYLTKIEDIKESFRYQMVGMVEDDFYTFERDNITYHFFFTPGRRTENKFAILAVDYGIRFDKEPYKNERGTTTIPFSRIHDEPQQKGYFEFTSETHPELVNAMYEDNKDVYRDLIVTEMAKHMSINESNELEQRAKKHKKKSKGMGWHMTVDAGDVEKGIEVFNNATSCNSGECSSMGEAVEKRTYYYDGPIYYRGRVIAEKSNITTKAPSLGKALSNILYKAAKGDRAELYHYDIEDDKVRDITDNEDSINDKEFFTCDECGHPLNDMGQCPACEQGEEERYDDLTNLEALWELSKLDNNV